MIVLNPKKIILFYFSVRNSEDIKFLSRITTQAFNQRRKTVRNSLGDLFSVEELTELGIDLSTRAENISVEQYCKMANYLSNRSE